jgi:class 3 adenylate cyclase
MLARRERPFRASSAIARYDGFVAKFMGDGILAYFGFPRAHEDNAERAVHAGLEIAEVVAGLETSTWRDCAAGGRRF